MSTYVKIAIAVGVLLALAAAAWFISGSGQAPEPELSTAPVINPIDPTLDFYEEWLEMRQESSSPSATTIPASVAVADELRQRLTDTLATNPELDPILCLTTVPDKIKAQVVFTTDTEAEVLVRPAGDPVPERAIVKLTAAGSTWAISGITCSAGEVAPDLEFTFEQTGSLLRDSLQPPLDPTRWHVIYSRDGQPGHAAPLFFDADSMCVGADDTATTCVPTTFTEAQAVTIKGQLMEAGVDVQRVELP